MKLPAIVLENFRAQLAAQHAKRDGHTFDEWHDAEISFMWTLVNAARRKIGAAEVTRDQIRRVESVASGHSDYALKFALYCRDLVFSDKVEP